MITIKIKQAFAYSCAFALKNSPFVLGNVLLWLLTIWVSYINSDFSSLSY